MLGINILHQIIDVDKIYSPNLILDELHIKIREQLKQDTNNVRDGMDISFCVIDVERKILEFAGANNPLVYVRNGSQYIIKGDKFSIGGHRKQQATSFSNHVISINMPTSFYLYTDGFQDQFGGNDFTKYMSKRFRELLLENADLPMPIQRQNLTTELQKWKGEAEQTDDILVIGFKTEL
jgi:serine phosphatase RsbU (regulator of sigma subunit)